MQLQQQKSDLDSLGVAVVVVTFESSAIAQNYAREIAFPWPIVRDETRELYRAYDMDRGSNWAVYGPQSWWGYIKLLLSGRKLRLPTDDVHQLGGDVLIDPAGIVRVHHVGRTPIDRPTVESLLSVVRDAQSKNQGEPGV